MRHLLLTLLIVNGILLPLGCVPVLAILGISDPMAAAFITDIHVRNAGSDPIMVTPVGAYGRQGHRASLPVYSSRDPAIRSSRAGGFLVPPGQTLELLYDWDDINLSEIVITLADGTSRQLVVDPEPTRGRYRPPATNRFTIGDPAQLEPVPPDVAAAAAAAAVESPRSLWPLLPLFLPWLTFAWLLTAYGRRTGAGRAVAA